eukprot:jgi/Hompol1/400/HPOL_002511-RA
MAFELDSECSALSAEEGGIAPSSGEDAPPVSSESLDICLFKRANGGSQSQIGLDVSGSTEFDAESDAARVPAGPHGDPAFESEFCRSDVCAADASKNLVSTGECCSLDAGPYDSIDGVMESAAEARPSGGASLSSTVLSLFCGSRSAVTSIAKLDWIRMDPAEPPAT